MVIQTFKTQMNMRPYFPQRGETGRGDRVDLSQDAQLVAALRRKIKELPEVRSEQVERLRRLVMEGRYSVSSEEIVDLMLRRIIADRVR